MAKHWIQIGGDVNPKEHGATLVRRAHSSLGEQIEVVDITPGDDGYYVTTADIPVDDLTWEKNRDVAKAHGHERHEWEASELEHRAMDRLNYWGGTHLGGGYDFVTKWSAALPARSNQIRWWR